MIARLLFIVALVMLATAAAAQPIQLITEKEAKFPPATQAPARAITRGPAVKLLSPEGVVNGVFPLKIVFEPHGGSKVDPTSVQVIYLKNPTVDLTDRIKSGVRADGIDLASVTAPRGEHPIRISVRDDETENPVMFPSTNRPAHNAIEGFGETNLGFIDTQTIRLTVFFTIEYVVPHYYGGIYG